MPNALTATRLLAIPFIAFFAFTARGDTSQTAGWIFAAVAITDFLDGALARRLGVESAFGKIADPLADRLLIIVGLVGLLALGRVNPAAPIIQLARDGLALVAFPLLVRAGYRPRIDLAGKVSSWVVMTAIPLSMGYHWPWLPAFMWFAVALSVATLANYTRQLLAAGREPRQSPDARAVQ